jgi:hypothetical protein
VDDDWVPLSVRVGARADYDSLYEGVPLWLRESIWDWCEDHLRSDRGGWLIERLQEIERRFRHRLNWGSSDTSAAHTIRNAMATDPDFFLDVVDFLLHETGDASTLEEILVQGGSAWRASEGGQLERRVPEAVAAAAERIMGTAARAGQHLALAWRAAFGRSPDPSTAYREAVKSVEAAAAPIVSPRDPAPTLGTMIAAFRDAPGKWQIVLKPARIDPHAAVLGMMQLLWFSQHDRHGTADDSAPLNVSQDEAEAAVYLAVTLVQWFTSGAVKAI